jgi:glucose-6-phosphate 1-epimerase
MNSLEQLNANFSIPETLKFEAGNGGLIRCDIRSPLATAHVYLHGAHLTHFQPLGQKDLIYLSSKADFIAGKPIRGGVPICFPFFGYGPKDDQTNPFHGFARTLPWHVASARKAAGDSVQLVLALSSDDQTRKIWPFDFSAQYTIFVGSELHLALEITNTGNQPLEFEEALHTYFAISDIGQIAINGLENTDYLDKTQGMKKFPQGPIPITFSSETDRIYLNTRSACIARDPAGGREIWVAKDGSQTTVVWNPGIEKAKGMRDLGDGEWTKMVCIETCNVKDFAVTLEPGKSHTMSATISPEVLSE